MNHRAVANFNLSTCPAGDMWAATLVPTADGAKVITGDTACVNPPFTPSPGAPRELAFSVRDVQTDQTLTYASRVLGLPVVGFMVAYAPQRQPVLRECDLPG